MLCLYRSAVRTSALFAALAVLGTAPAAQQPAAVRGRVEIGVPVATRRPAAGYPTRTIARKALAPASELRHVVVYLKDAPAAPAPPVTATIVRAVRSR